MRYAKNGHMYEEAAETEAASQRSVTTGPAREADQLAVARLTGAAWRNASTAYGAPGADAAVCELRELADGRGDLLAQVAGLLIGYYRRTAEEARARAAAYLCIAAGAQIELLPQWINLGGSRGAAARLIPPAVPETGLVYEWPEAV
jgi:hypothetical protein